jgi:hypothetical protein
MECPLLAESGHWSHFPDIAYSCYSIMFLTHYGGPMITNNGREIIMPIAAITTDEFIIKCNEELHKDKAYKEGMSFVSIRTGYNLIGTEDIDASNYKALFNRIVYKVQENYLIGFAPE